MGVLDEIKAISASSWDWAWAWAERGKNKQLSRWICNPIVLFSVETCEIIFFVLQADFPTKYS